MKNYKKIDPDQWYQFRKRISKANPFIMGMIFRYLTDKPFTKLYGIAPIKDIGIFEGYQHTDNILLKSFEDFGKSILIKVKDHNFTSTLAAKSRFYANAMAKKLKFKNLATLSDKQLYRLYSELVELYGQFALYSIPLWLLGEKALATEAKKILEKKSTAQLDKIYTTIITPANPSYTFKEELEILKLAKDKCFSKEKLQKLANNYGFIIYDNQGPNSKKVADYLKEIKTVAEKNNIEFEYAEKKNYYGRFKRQQNKIIAGLKFNAREKNIIQALQHAALLQDMRKYYNAYFNFKTENLFREMAKRLKTDYTLLRYLAPQEMEIVWKSQKLNSDLKQRLKECVLTVENGKANVYTGKALQPFLLLKKEEADNEKTELRGEIASLGKTSGIARVLMSAGEIEKIKKGEVLVTPMTTPDFMTAIKKCVAIVTDEGGITCHAAIIAREMRIPCIIGTKNATRVLHDGDLVEVDADAGVVRILKPAGLKNKT